MPSICLYFQVHQPSRLRKYTFFDIGNSQDYEDEANNRAILLKVAKKCYLPTNALLLELIKKWDGRFKVSFSLTGSVIEQFKRFSPETLDSFKALADTGCVEMLNETYHHSLTSVFSKEAFIEEVKQHQDLIKKEFGQTATTFRNTEFIYNNELAALVESLGYQAILAEGTDKVLEGRSPNYLYQPHGTKNIKLLLKNYPLSDDIAFRFSDKSWTEYPCTADKFASWIHAINPAHDLINLFMDYETFGEHQWADTGIFDFLNALPAQLLQNPNIDFCTPRQAVKKMSAKCELNSPNFYSWADTERDLTAWIGNHLQDDALETVYALEHRVRALNVPSMMQTWKSLLTSDHFYYMCTKSHADGDVHQYFNPYNNPYDAFINVQNVVKDFSLRVDALASASPLINEISHDA